MQRFVPIAAFVIASALGLAACGDDDDSGAATTTTSSSTTTEAPRSTTTTTDPADVEAEVIEAYEAAWEDFFRAGDPPDPDAPFLADHRTGENLTSTRNGLAGFRSEGVVATGSFETGIVSVSVDGDTASIEDCGLDLTELRSAATGAVVAAPPGERDGLDVELVREEGAWKVQRLLRSPRVCDDVNTGSGGDDSPVSEES